MRVDLPDGNWAELRERVTNGDRKRFLQQIDVEGSNTVKALAGSDALVALCVTAWSLGPLPKDDPTVLDDLDCEVYDAILEKSAAAAKVLFPNFDPSPEPGTPTTPSGA